jgi:hypothetical protein
MMILNSISGFDPNIKSQNRLFYPTELFFDPLNG